MKLSTTQLQLLQIIQGKLVKGDVDIIANKTGLTRDYVRMILNPNSGFYKENVITEAVEIITNREQNTENLLKKINAFA